MLSTPALAPPLCRLLRTRHLSPTRYAFPHELVASCANQFHLWKSKEKTTGRCFKGVDPRLESDSKLVPIDKEANHQIVHRCRFGKATGAPNEPRDPGPQVEVFAFDFLRVLLADVMLLWGDGPLVRAPPIGVKAGETTRCQ
jgi:hypothetical protein